MATRNRSAADYTADYATRLAERVRQWRERNPELYAQLEREAVEKLALPLKHRAEPRSPVIQMVIDAAVQEAVRALKEWPTERQYAQR